MRPRAVVLAAVLAALAAAGACSDVRSSGRAAPSTDPILDSADQVAFGFRTLVTDAGLLRAEVFADTALFLEQNTRASLRVVHGEFFGATGAKEATLTARRGNLDTRTNVLEAWGDVVITSVDGRVLKSPMVRYEQSKNQVMSDSAFVLTEPGEKEISGIGFRTDPSLNAVEVLKVRSGRGGTVKVPRRVSLLRRVLAVATSVATLPLALGAQDGRPCSLVFTGVARGADTTHMTAFTTPTGGRNTFIGGGVDATCEGQGNRLLADSAEHYAERGELILIARVRYSEPRMTMQSDRMVYYTVEDRLLATGNVRGRSASGTRFEGPQMEYFRAKPGIREVPSWRAPGRPFVRMSPTAAQPTAPTSAAAPRPAAPPGDSVDLRADLVVSENDSLVWASGNVVIERPDLLATADSATLDQGREFARLLRKPEITGRGDRPFILVGTVIDLWSKDRRLERVRADGAAQVTSDSLTLTGDTIDLRLADQRIERVHAWGMRATADSPEQRLEADSLDILMPGQRLREVHAIGRAVARSVVDTLRIETTERDWIAGDTILARFDSLPPSDSTNSARMREVIATGSARAFYQLAPPNGERGAPNLSYNRGRVITVNFDAGELRDVVVQDRASGIYLEPTPVDTSTRTTATPREVAVHE